MEGWAPGKGGYMVLVDLEPDLDGEIEE